RLDAENQTIFISVAAEMSRMEQQMNLGVEAAFTELDEIVQEAASGRKVLQGLCESLHVVAQKSIQHIRSELDSLRDRLRPCAEASSSICELLALTRQQTSELITALQYQDIVQQQLHHVDEGFSDMVKHLDDRTSDVAFIRTAARVQREHLKSSRASIEGAGEKIGGATEALMVTGSRLVREFVQMQQVADAVFSEAGISDLFSKETDKLIEIASSSEVTNQRIAKLLERIEASVRLFSTDICRHEFEVQLVALNAQVASARVAEAHALNKLAEETAIVASDTSDLIQLMRRELAETLDGLLRMRREASEIQETISKEREELSAGSLAVAAKLSKLDEKIRQGSSGVAEGFGLAYENVRNLVNALGFTKKIDPAFAPAQAICAAIIDATEGCVLEGAHAPSDNRLVDHEKRYTMKSERDAHAAAMGPVASPAAPASGDGDMAIEFFESPPQVLEVAVPVRDLTPTAASAEGSVELF
ncbi:MAG TPA: hypothetical protein VFE25_13640, partial [Opitutaceae bacterium]|nr:hypothetical protein [Opitutaceae bacterium]